MAKKAVGVDGKALIAERVFPLIEAARPILTVPKPSFEEIANPNQRKALLLMSRVLAEAMMALFEISSVYDDFLVIEKVGKKSPVPSSGIRKSEHLRLVWFNHMNLCYLFEEKVKWFRTKQRNVGRLFKLEVKRDFDDGHLKVLQGKIKQTLGKNIRARGQTFHEWYQEHEHLSIYSTIEFANEIGPKKFEEMEMIYRLVKSDVLNNIESSTSFVLQALLDIADNDIEYLRECFQIFDRAWKACKERPTTIEIYLKEEAAV